MMGIAVRAFLFVLSFAIGICFSSLGSGLQLNENAQPLPISVLTVESEAAPDTSFVDPLPEMRPSPDGIYFPVNTNKFEKETALTMFVLDGHRGGSIKIGDDFLSSDLTIEESGKVRMRSESTGGVYFIFEGRFLKDGFEEYFDHDDPVLEGKLSKYRNGERLYSFSSKYTYVTEVCAWNENNREQSDQ